MLAYTAGFFDGEGSINILTRKRKDWNTEYSLSVAIGQKDGKTLDWIKDNFGGNVYLVKRDGTFYWSCGGGRNAEKFLRSIYPFLQYKKPQAELAFEFYSGRKNRTNPISKKELARREKIRLNLIAIKKNPIRSQYAGSTTKRADPKGM